MEATMVPLLTPAVERYLAELTPPSEAVLRGMEREAGERGFPIVGPQVGRLLFVLARAVRAELVFELGSGYGYSALWFALALAEGGRVILTDGDRANSRQAREHFARAGLADRAVFEVGNALDVLDGYPGPFDIVFCDIDKADYPAALAKAVPRLRRGGLLVADNVLWSGRVAGPDDDPETRGIREFNRLLMASPDLVAAILPVRDGVAVAVRL
jgi:predicted O-methyltransferase YrrM